jgi:hypothetical protein
VTVKDIVLLYLRTNGGENRNTIERALRIKYLPEGWRSHFEKQFNVPACDDSNVPS